MIIEQFNEEFIFEQCFKLDSEVFNDFFGIKNDGYERLFSSVNFIKHSGKERNALIFEGKEYALLSHHLSTGLCRVYSRGTDFGIGMGSFDRVRTHEENVNFATMGGTEGFFYV